jgi:hypothetical protein
MNATEKRTALMQVASALQAELAKVREALRPLSQVAADLVSAADSLLMVSAEEITAGDVKQVRRVKSNASGDIAIEGDIVAYIAPPTAENIEHVTRVLGEAKRKCSVCRQPGHRAQNCPNAHVVQAQKVKAVAQRDAARKPKRKMKPLSPERKAQLIATLAKVRATDAYRYLARRTK